MAHAGHRLLAGRDHWQGFPEEERFQRMYGLSSFFIGEQRVTDELGPIICAAPTEEMKIFLSTQIADEARHVRFFDRFYSEVGVLDSSSLSSRLEETSAHLNPGLQPALRRDARVTHTPARRATRATWWRSWRRSRSTT